MAHAKTGSENKNGRLTVSRQELIVEGSDETFRHFVHGILALSERWQTVRAGFGEVLGLTGIQYTTLISISHMQRHGTVSVRELADHLHFSGTFITTITGQLEKMGLIIKKQDKKDRRKVELQTTKKTERLLSELAPFQQSVNDELFACLSRKDFERLAALVDELVTCADRAISLQNHLKMAF